MAPSIYHHESAVCQLLNRTFLCSLWSFEGSFSDVVKKFLSESAMYVHNFKKCNEGKIQLHFDCFSCKCFIGKVLNDAQRFFPGKLSSSIKEDFSREDSISVVHVFLASLVASTTSFQACLEII